MHACAGSQRRYLPNNCAPEHGAQVRRHLRHRDLVRPEFELVLQHSRIQVLGSVRLSHALMFSPPVRKDKYSP